MPEPHLYRRTLLQSTVGLLGLGLLDDSQAAEADPTIGRNLTFGDDFSAIDWSIWNAGPKASTWDSGFYGRSAFARREGEEGFDPYDIIEDSEAENGSALRIRAHYLGKRMSVPNYYGNDLAEYQWISGNLQMARSDGTVTKGWRTGYFEARMQFPSHPLTWPAFWLMNRNSILAPKTSLEIDVVEHKGWEPHVYGAYLHEWGQPGEHHEGTGVTTPIDMTTGYALYGVLIDATKCVPYFNRQVVIDTKTGAPAHWEIGRSSQLDIDNDVFWPLLTLALRNDVPYPANLTEAQRTAELKIDYFRVYQ